MKMQLGKVAFTYVETGYNEQYNFGFFDFVTTEDGCYLSIAENNVGNSLTDTKKWVCLASGKEAFAAAKRAIAAAEAAEKAASEAGANDQDYSQNERLRISAEEERKLAEDSREQSESERSNAETERGNTFNELQSAFESAIAQALETAQHPTIVGEDNYIYKWNSSTKAYDKTNTYVRGEGFHVSKVFASVLEMLAYDGENLKEGDFVLINTNDVENPDNAKLYTYGGTKGSYTFLVDMSGAIGFTGKTPQISIGTITTGAAGTSASASLQPDGTDSDGNPKYLLSLVIPRGNTFTYADLTEEDKEDLRTPAKEATQAANDAAKAANDAAQAANDAASDTNSVKETIQNWYDTLKGTAETWYTTFKQNAENFYNNTMLVTWKNWYDNFKQDAETWWQNVTLWDEKRTEIDNWWATTKSTWTLWFSDSLPDGVRKLWSEFYAACQQSWETISKDATEAAGKANTQAEYAKEQGDYAKGQGDYAKDVAGHQPYIADGTESKPGDTNYWYVWDNDSKKYVRSIYAKGDNLHYDEMTETDRQELTDAIINSLAIMPQEDASAIWDGYTFEMTD